MYEDGTRVVLPDGREGVIEVSSADDWVYHVRLDNGNVIQVPENWIEPISEAQAQIDRVSALFLEKLTARHPDHPWLKKRTTNE